MPRRAAFTLLEVLLALTLGSMLMLGLFSVLRVQGRVASEGGRRVEQAQLARGLLETLADEVRSCVRPARTYPAGTDDTAGLLLPMAPLADLGFEGTRDLPGPLITLAARSDLPAAGLFGDADYLIVSPRVHFDEPRDPSFPTLSDNQPGVDRSLGYSEGDFGGTPRNRRSAHSIPGRSLDEPPAGLTGIAYFVAGDRSRGKVVDGVETQDDVAGLARIELARADPESTKELIAQALKAFEAPPDEEVNHPRGDRESPANASDTGSAFAVPGLRAELVAPEVRWVRFRYLGPLGWQSEWPAGAELPSAVEIALGLAADDPKPRYATPLPADARQSVEDGEQRPTSLEDGANAPLSSTANSLSDVANAEQVEAVQRLGLRVYRLVVRVPVGPTLVTHNDRGGQATAWGFGAGQEIAGTALREGAVP